jgi:endonuclease/exonuclease/phosphatase family metal-dependent hydrolase
MDGEIKVISWNLLHRAGATIGEVERLIDRQRPDLFLMQEATEAIDILAARIGGYYTRFALPGRRHGLAAWSRSAFDLPPVALTLQAGVIVRRVCQIIVLDAIGLANVHLSHGQLLNRRQLRRIAEILPARAVIMGDYNMIGAPMLPGFRDAGPRQPTHMAGTMLPLRLDRCLVRGLDCIGAKILPAGASDHLPICVRLVAPPV